MDDNGWSGEVAAAIFFIVLSGVLGFGAGSCSQLNHWQKEAIERGLAEYNKTTGIWQWKDAQTPDEPRTSANAAD